MWKKIIIQNKVSATEFIFPKKLENWFIANKSHGKSFLLSRKDCHVKFLLDIFLITLHLFHGISVLNFLMMEFQKEKWSSNTHKLRRVFFYHYLLLIALSLLTVHAMFLPQLSVYSYFSCTGKNPQPCISPEKLLQKERLQ